MSLDAWMQVLFLLQVCMHVGQEQVCMDASCVLYKIRIEMILLWSAVYICGSNFSVSLYEYFILRLLLLTLHAMWCIYWSYVLNVVDCVYKHSVVSLFIAFNSTCFYLALLDL